MYNNPENIYEYFNGLLSPSDYFEIGKIPYFRGNPKIMIGHNLILNLYLYEMNVLQFKKPSPKLAK